MSRTYRLKTHYLNSKKEHNKHYNDMLTYYVNICKKWHMKEIEFMINHKQDWINKNCFIGRDGSARSHIYSNPSWCNRFRNKQANRQDKQAIAYNIRYAECEEYKTYSINKYLAGWDYW